MNLSGTYLKRSGGPGNDGMLVELKMGKKRIVDLADAVAFTDAPTKKQLDSIAEVSNTFSTPWMTSNNAPSPFTTSSNVRTSDAWKAFSKTNSFTPGTSDIDTVLVMNFGQQESVNCLQLQLSDQVDSITVADDNNTVLLHVDLPTAGLQYFTFVQSLVTSVSINISFFSPSSTVSGVTLTNRVVNIAATTLVVTDGKVAKEAVNVGYLNNALLPLSSSVVPVFANPPMTSNTTPTPYTVSSSVSFIVGHEPFKAFDFDYNTSFQSVSGNAQVDLTIAFGSAGSVAVKGVEVSAPQDTLYSGTQSFNILGTDYLGATVLLLAVDTPIPQIPTLYNINTSVPLASVTLSLTAMPSLPSVGIGLCNIFTDGLSVKNRRLVNLSAPFSNNDAVTKSYVDSALALKLNNSGGNMTGDLNMVSNNIVGLGGSSDSTSAVTRLNLLNSSNNLPTLGSVLPMSDGAVLFTATNVQLADGLFTTLPLNVSRELTPNPSGAGFNYFGFTGSDAVTAVGGSYYVILQLLITEATTPYDMITVQLKSDATVISEELVRADKTLSIKFTFFATTTATSDLSVQIKYGTGSALVSKAEIAFFAPVTSSTIKRQQILSASAPSTPLGVVSRKLPIVLSSIVPHDIIVPYFTCSGNTINIVSSMKMLLQYSCSFDVLSTNNANGQVSFTVLSENCTPATFTHGPYKVSSRKSSTEPSLRQVSFYGYVITNPGSTCTISVDAICTLSAGISIENITCLVQSRK